MTDSSVHDLQAQIAPRFRDRIEGDYMFDVLLQVVNKTAGAIATHDALQRFGVATA